MILKNENKKSVNGLRLPHDSTRFTGGKKNSHTSAFLSILWNFVKNALGFHIIMMSISVSVHANIKGINLCKESRNIYWYFGLLFIGLENF